jgi:hypothetical protein
MSELDVRSSVAPSDTLSYFDEPVFIVGPPRSGTSLVTGALGECGLWLGPRWPGTRANPKGFFENPDFKRQVTKRLLGELGADPLGVEPLPPLDQPAPCPWLRVEIQAVIENQGYVGRVVWGVKDPKLTLLWPTLSRCFPRARWVVVRRDPKDIRQSCRRAPFLAYRNCDEVFWEQFVQEYEVRLNALVEAVPRCREIRPCTLVDGDMGPFHDIVDWLGLLWRSELIARLVEPSLWHFRTS